MFPRYDIFEDLSDVEEIVVIDHFAFGGPAEAPCNWFQTHENSVDAYHVFILHGRLRDPGGPGSRQVILPATASNSVAQIPESTTPHTGDHRHGIVRCHRQ